MAKGTKVGRTGTPGKTGKGKCMMDMNMNDPYKHLDMGGKMPMKGGKKKMPMD